MYPRKATLKINYMHLTQIQSDLQSFAATHQLPSVHDILPLFVLLLTLILLLYILVI